MPKEDETRVTSSTGGEKGKKLPQLGWAPPDALWELAKVYGYGAEKYSPTNFRSGYEWSLSVDAIYRHLLSWLGGETNDPESERHHLAHLSWHALNLIYMENEFPELDDVRWDVFGRGDLVQQKLFEGHGDG